MMSSYWKKAIMCIMALSLFLLRLNAFAEGGKAASHKHGDFTYTILENGTAEITKWTGETEELSIPSALDGYSVTSIGRLRFRNSDVQRVTIPDSVVSIASDAFVWTDKLSAIDVSEDNPAYKSVDGVLYTSDMKTLVCYPGGKTDDSYSVPEVTETIGDYAFYGCENLNSIVFQDTLKRIGVYAFAGCKMLKELNLPDELETIDGGAFSGCENVSVLTIPSSIVSAFGGGQLREFSNLKTVHLAPGTSAIPDGMFSWCQSITSVTVPDGVQSIGKYAFSNCENLQELTIPNTVTAIGENAFCNCSSLKTIVIPDGITTIEESTFYNCSSLSSVVIPDSVSYIGEWAFSHCDGLSGIIIPGSVSIIDESAFWECKTLSEVLMQEGVRSIGKAAFCGCSKLSRVSVPSSVKEIGDIAFYDCSSYLSISTPYGSYAESYARESYYLTYNNNYREAEIQYPAQRPVYLNASNAGSYYYNVQDDETAIIVRYTGNEEIARIPGEINGIKVTAIGDGAFDSNERIRSASIPDGITNVGNNPFSACSSLINIQVSPNHPTLAVINGVLFRKADKCLISYPGALEESTYAVPQGITKIGEYAFYGCNQLKTVSIPNSVLSIGKCAFQRCAGLKELTIPNSVTSIGAKAFAKCSIKLMITVDPDSYAANYCVENQLPFTYPNANDWLFN